MIAFNGYWRCLCLYLLFGATIRLCLLWLIWDFYSVHVEGPVTWFGVAHSLLLGAVNDLAAAIYLLLPLIILISMSPRLGRLGLSLISCCLLILFSLFLIIFASDLGVWVAFGVRLNRLFFHYLNFPYEVAVYLHEQLFLAFWIAALVLVLFYLYQRLLPFSKKLSGLVRSSKSAMLVMCAVLVAVLVFPKVTQFAVVNYQQDRMLQELSKNAFMNLSFAAWVNVTDWAESYPRLNKSELRRHNVSGASNTSGDQQYTTVPDLAHIKHVVLIVAESFAGRDWWDLDRRKLYMPKLQELTEEGAYFDNVYATGTRTTRGLEAILHGFPPLPGIAVNQRAGMERLPSLPRQLQKQGFSNLFVYSGWPEFSRFSSYWRSIGYNKIFTREDFADGFFETSWGVADEKLFDRLLDEMDAEVAQGGRVFVSTLTVSNHRPFDIPAGKVPFPNERKLEYAIAYADWALGEFFRQAKTKPWYDDTLFVVTADHGPRIYGNSTIPVKSYKVPVLFLAKGLAADTHDTLGSIMDIPSTVLGLLGVSGRTGFWGGNLFLGSHGRALVEHDYRVGMISQTHQRKSLTLIAPGASSETWLLNDGEVDNKIETDSEAVDAVVGVFQSAHETFYADGQGLQPGSR